MTSRYVFGQNGLKILDNDLFTFFGFSDGLELSPLGGDQHHQLWLRDLRTFLALN
jgi:hypothetical protein